MKTSKAKTHRGWTESVISNDKGQKTYIYTSKKHPNYQIEKPFWWSGYMFRDIRTNKLVLDKSDFRFRDMKDWYCLDTLDHAINVIENNFKF